jgi:hypothetical protein
MEASYRRCPIDLVAISAQATNAVVAVDPSRPSTQQKTLDRIDRSRTPHCEKAAADADRGSALIHDMTIARPAQPAQTLQESMCLEGCREIAERAKAANLAMKMQRFQERQPYRQGGKPAKL